MAKYRCNICSKNVFIENETSPCPECGSLGGVSQYVFITDGVERFNLTAGNESYIVYLDNTLLTRALMKRFFPSLTDDAGNPAYRYLEIGTGINSLLFSKNEDGVFCVSAQEAATNHFLLNGNHVEAIPVLVKKTDIIDLFSTKQGKCVARFVID